MSPNVLQLKAQFPDAFKAPELAVPPKHTFAALGGPAQHKELLDRWVLGSLKVTAGAWARTRVWMLVGMMREGDR